MMQVSEVRDGSVVLLQISVDVESVGDGCELALFVNGERVEAAHEGFAFTAVVDVPSREHEVRHSEWREPYGSMVVAVVRTPDGRMSGAFAVSSGPV